MKYASKTESRRKGPFYVGRKENYSEEYAGMELRQWQKKLKMLINVIANSLIL